MKKDNLSDLEAINTKRKLAAAASNGSSNNGVYMAFDRVLTELSISGDLLDFGAGKGYLTQRIQQLFNLKSITAIDLIKFSPNIDNFIQWINCDLNEKIQLKNNSFDVIISSEVIEHLENPRAVAREWFRLLRPGGILVFSTPNNESWRSLLALVFRGHFVAFSDSCYPAHITPLLRKDIERILNEAGFSIPTFIFTNVGSIPKIPNFYWQAVSFGILKGLRYSDNLLVIAKKPAN